MVRRMDRDEFENFVNVYPYKYMSLLESDEEVEKAEEESEEWLNDVLAQYDSMEKEIEFLKATIRSIAFLVDNVDGVRYNRW